VFNSAPPPAPRAAAEERAKATTGADAVQMSRQARAQQDATRVIDGQEDESSSAARDSVRKVGDKTFYLRDGVWTDAEYKADARLPETTLTFASDEYFELARREPQLAKYLALGERVLVVFKGRVYRVAEGKR
jgi:hypothetical protein